MTNRSMKKSTIVKDRNKTELCNTIYTCNIYTVIYSIKNTEKVKMIIINVKTIVSI